MKILYLTDNDTVHNTRFLEKLVGAGKEVWAWNLTATETSPRKPVEGVKYVVSGRKVDPDSSPEQYRDLLPQLQSLLIHLQPSVVHAGPIQTAGYLAALADFHPLLVMSWGSDVLINADRNSEWKHATEFTLLRADALFSDCNAVRERANIFRKFSDTQIVQFPWGIKKGAFSSKGNLPSAEKVKLDSATTTFIYTRSYEQIYGANVLLEAFVIAHRTNPSLRLLLVGNGSQDASIVEFVEAHDLQRAVILVGPQPVTEIPAWFRVADAYISCAKSDGTSISLLEAMATGLPVLVTDIPSNREWVSEPQNGWLTPSGSASGVAEKMLQAASLTDHERQKIAENNQTIVAQRADWDRNFPKLLEMYQRLAVAKNEKSYR